jgi:hypothetical protein
VGESRTTQYKRSYDEEDEREFIGSNVPDAFVVKFAEVVKAGVGEGHIQEYP